jgi:hypothetical protein
LSSFILVSSGWLLGWFLLDFATANSWGLTYDPCALTPGVLAFLNGCDLRAALRGQVLLAKMFGTILAVGGGLALGPEGHFWGDRDRGGLQTGASPISRSSVFDYSATNLLTFI